LKNQDILAETPYAKIFSEKKKRLAEALLPHLKTLFTEEAKVHQVDTTFLDKMFETLARDFAGNFYYQVACTVDEQKKAEERRRFEESEKERLEAMKPLQLSYDDFKNTIIAKWRSIVTQEDTNAEFAIDQYCSSEFTRLLNYFYGHTSLGYKAHKGSYYGGTLSGDSNCEYPSELDTRKGFLIMGPVGCRKTSMMQAFQNNPFASFRIIEAQDMVQAYKEAGDMAFNYFHISDKRNKFGHESYEICIDEVGREERSVIAKGASFSSTHINFIEEYIFRLYKSPRRLHLITNATNYEDLVKTYSEAAASRLLKLFNVVIFPENSPNYRLV
jgi:SpoVK/Ycf46/Vps4 family AAA+-type ATPase